MKWLPFHHPDISLPVIRRKAGNELLTLVAGTAELLLSGGRSTLYKQCYPNSQAFRASVARLRKQGLISVTQSDGSLPRLTLTSAATPRLPVYYTPGNFWKKKWTKWWYVLMFDVPEKNRSYRDTLRSFLKGMRCGCLQKSVWVTPTDIRANYNDLNRAAAVDSVAFLFESKTVLGFGDQSVVREAWDFDKINRIHELYIQFAEENLFRLRDKDSSNEEITQLLRADNLAYSQAMTSDPLLPRELHPEGYNGESVFRIHSKLVQQAAKKING